LEAARETAKPITLAGAREQYLAQLCRLTLPELKAEIEALEEAYMAVTNPALKRKVN
jgi:hypothetical protein